MQKNLSYTENDMLWYWFVNMAGIGLQTRKVLIDHFGHPGELPGASHTLLSSLVRPGQLAALMSSYHPEEAAGGLCRLQESGTSFIHWESENYPEKFRNLPCPPYGLYLRGRLPDPKIPSIAMIGSRRSTAYGRSVARDFAAGLAGAGVQIISGLAEGIDTESHRGALMAGRYTLGILGGGIDTIYPRENFNLYMDMYQTGGVLSEWNMGIPNKAGLFPMRNRLISALSDGVFVLEAALRSGTNITVDQALEQGKTVYALPGRITDVNSMGTNLLIREGAVPVLSLDDIIGQLELAGFVTERKGRAGRETGRPGEMIDGAGEAAGMLTEPQKQVLDMIDEQDPVSFERLMRLGGFDTGSLHHILYQLEVHGLISQPVQHLYLKRCANLKNYGLQAILK